ncbi:MAG: AEC family transporter [SAR202 cluster bacterium]|nr:AEC family transporter [SAR202 cluster bacterium]|tara:strand:- start:5396 stop:6301 length:906 start_codon:yes stop_codon:yes gene_type:complete
MISVFYNIILPILLVASFGVALQKLRPSPLGFLSPALLYILSPCLVIDGIINADLPTNVSIKIVTISITCSLVMLVLGFVIANISKMAKDAKSSFVLASTFPNAGNMGIPISFLAFGEEGLSVALIIFVAQGIISWPLGTLIVARGQTIGWKEPLIQVLKLPTLYAVPIALFIRFINFSIPSNLYRPIDMMADAAIPCMLLLLGYQLSNGLKEINIKDLVLVNITRLIFSIPIVAIITIAFNVTGTAQNTLIVMAAMPTAVFTVLLATEFGTKGQYVANSVITSTLLSMISLTILIYYLTN